MRQANVRLASTIAFCFVAGVACTQLAATHGRECDRSQALWRSMALTDYDCTLRSEAMREARFTQARRIQVRGGAVVRATSIATGEPLDVKDSGTIDQIFAEIARTRQSGRVLSATYDPTFGFPVEVRLDPILNAIDDEHSYFVSDFQRKTP